MTETENTIMEADVIVIGAGPGGMTAALYASRANLKTILIEKGAPGGELINTADVENYPGYTKIAGPDLAQNFYDSAMAFGAQHEYGDVNKIEIDGLIRRVFVGDKVYQAPVLILAMGAHHRELQVPGEKDLNGRGVSYCAVCDGFFFRDKDIVVVGGGDSAVEEGTYLTQFAKSVSIIHRRDQLRAQKILQDRAFANDKIHFIWDSVVEEIQGDPMVQAVQVKNVKTGEEKTMPTDGVFVYVGLVPNAAIAEGLGISDPEGWIVTNDLMETKIPGVFAVGDVRQKHLRQVATAVGDGALAGQGAYNYLQALND
ncbi:thioredoxin-disulfide reductase [Eremococcus coleocola]|uniref:Thioredoxin reductase n=1 Tax=Eremococcus coleocola ACS-139-V-Col8 TaxID=908337 RepID=E4KMW1_9LACT|nr:thioredoxin-disulfide reductase [Eremococcus coleocola]EFR31609.1 thioredoxin-disulfide reductase [Eremococcus coleocola ACS-139-V-Col8]